MGIRETELRPPVPLRHIRSRGRVRTSMALVGPAFVASVAYVDPGNFATNFAGGAKLGYQLVWVIVMANFMAILVQYVASKLGLGSGCSLPELCRQRFGRKTNVMLWLQSEVVAMATDLAEFVGAAVGLNLVFHIPLLPAGLITGAVAFAILALEQRGYRRFEIAVVALLGLVAGSIAYLLFSAGRQRVGSFASGLVPSIGGADAASLTVAIIGATVMPHVVYLHSALQSRRIQAADAEERRILLRYNAWDCIVGLGVAGLVNLAMLCIAAAMFHRPSLMDVSGLQPVYDHIEVLVGGGAALAFGLALIASGLSSSTVGTYSGQVVMAGFVDWRVSLWLRRLLTMLPSLLVLGLGLDPSSTLVLSQIVLSFGLPFALVPLLLISADRSVMRDFASRPLTTAGLAVVTLIVSGLNADLLITTVLTKV
jgi:manganese transport protein